MPRPDKTERARQLLTELIDAATKEDLKRSAELFVAFRTATGHDQQSFGDFVGVDIRSVKRWESPTERPAPIGKLNTWIRLFDLDHKPSDQLSYTDQLPEPNAGNLTGIFYRKGILTKIDAAEKIWVLKAHGKFRASATEYMLQFFSEKFRNEPLFEFHGAWLARGEKTHYLGEIIPGNTTRNSFLDLYKHIAQTIPNAKLYGYALQPEQASQCGLSNSPISILVIKYKKLVSDKILRSADVFFEMPVAIYHDQTRTLMEASEERWIQLHPETADEYCNKVWNLESRAKYRLTIDSINRQIEELSEFRKNAPSQLIEDSRRSFPYS